MPRGPPTRGSTSSGCGRTASARAASATAVAVLGWTERVRGRHRAVARAAAERRVVGHGGRHHRAPLPRPRDDRVRPRRAGVDGTGRRRVDSPVTLLREYLSALRKLLAGERVTTTAVTSPRRRRARVAAGERPRRCSPAPSGRSRCGCAGRRPTASSSPRRPGRTGCARPASWSATPCRSPSTSAPPSGPARSSGSTQRTPPSWASPTTTSPSWSNGSPTRAPHGRARADAGRARPRRAHPVRGGPQMVTRVLTSSPPSSAGSHAWIVYSPGGRCWRSPARPNPNVACTGIG